MQLHADTTALAVVSVVLDTGRRAPIHHPPTDAAATPCGFKFHAGRGLSFESRGVRGRAW
jgi:hypothetical protein